MAYTTIDDPTIFFNNKLYSGTSGVQTISGIGFEPSWIWTKSRTNAGNHQVTDQVRGLTKYIRPNAVNAEDTKTNAITAVNSNGFVLGADSSDDINANGQNYISYNWKANGQGSSNTDGSINTTYTSASTTSGFSISSYNGNGNVGATVGHGLGAVPTMIIVKRLNGASDWMVYHVKIGNNYRLRLNEDAAEQDNPVWNDTTPTSSVFYMNDNGDANASGGTYVAYCFSDVKAFSKMGTYKGNGNATNPAFIYTGFKPAFVMLKVSSTTDSWNMYDNRRLGYNGTGARLRANITNAEDTGTEYQTCDFYSNGFAPRGTDTTSNGSGKIYVYMAFAEAPFVNSSGIPATARV